MLSAQLFYMLAPLLWQGHSQSKYAFAFHSSSSKCSWPGQNTSVSLKLLPKSRSTLVLTLPPLLSQIITLLPSLLVLAFNFFSHYTCFALPWPCRVNPFSHGFRHSKCSSWKGIHCQKALCIFPFSQILLFSLHIITSWNDVMSIFTYIVKA